MPGTLKNFRASPGTIGCHRRHVYAYKEYYTRVYLYYAFACINVNIYFFLMRKIYFLIIILITIIVSHILWRYGRNSIWWILRDIKRCAMWIKYTKSRPLSAKSQRDVVIKNSMYIENDWNKNIKKCKEKKSPAGNQTEVKRSTKYL